MAQAVCLIGISLYRMRPRAINRETKRSSTSHSSFTNFHPGRIGVGGSLERPQFFSESRLVVDWPALACAWVIRLAIRRPGSQAAISPVQISPGTSCIHDFSAPLQLTTELEQRTAPKSASKSHQDRSSTGYHLVARRRAARLLVDRE